MLVVGVIAFASTFGLEDKSSTVSMALMVLGTGLFLWVFSGYSGNQKRWFIYRQAVLQKNIVYSLT